MKDFIGITLNRLIRHYRQELEKPSIFLTTGEERKKEEKLIQEQIQRRKEAILRFASFNLPTHKISFLMDEEQTKVETMVKEITACDGDLAADVWFLFNIVGDDEKNMSLMRNFAMNLLF